MRDEPAAYHAARLEFARWLAASVASSRMLPEIRVVLEQAFVAGYVVACAGVSSYVTGPGFELEAAPRPPFQLEYPPPCPHVYVDRIGTAPGPYQCTREFGHEGAHHLRKAGG